MNTCLKILLVDDDQDDYFHINNLLQEIQPSKYDLVWASNYYDGLKRLKEGHFDACLLDYRLGEKTGLDFLIESREHTFRCPIIFLTGLTDFDLDFKAMEMGASDYLVKNHLTASLLERSIRYSIKQAQDLDEINEVRAQILHKDRLASLGLLASSLAHEIGTPLGIIRSRAELAEKKAKENESLRKDMQIITLQIDRIAALVHSLLHLARDQKGSAGAVRLAEVIGDVLNLLEHEFERKNIRLIKPENSDFQVKAEAGPLGQVLINLLVNAIQAIESWNNEQKEVTRPAEVVFTVEDFADKVRITVADTGIGISEENFRHLFKPFFTTKDIGHGTGLGLAISYNIVNSWGGTIVVASQVGFGSKFSVILFKAG
ncbi:MAG: hybrid sensor histidine kinase/response regulator [Bdellovibrionales bacterium]|nr:hybrid sensor histidine kinase/response regulator [Bdellovibrionales bacterium]